LSDVGGQRYLAQQAIANPKSFLSLVGRVLPLQVTGAGGSPILLEQIATAAMAARDRLREQQRTIDVTPPAQLHATDLTSGDSKL